MANDPELPQDPGPRTGRIERAVPRTTDAERHAKYVETLRTMPVERFAGGEKQREDYLEAAAVRTRLLDGDPDVTIDDEMRADIRLTAKWRLKRRVPLDEFPSVRDPVVKYAFMRRARAKGATPDKLAAEAADAGRRGYWSWYTPKQDDAFECARLFAGLRRFGDRSDRRAMLDLLTRVGNVCEFLAVRVNDEISPPGAKPIPWLPPVEIFVRPVDRWWYGEQPGRWPNLPSWWRQEGDGARRLVPARGPIQGSIL